MHWTGLRTKRRLRALTTRASVCAAMFLTGCTSPGPLTEPSVTFTKLPGFSEGSSTKLDTIEGRATGIRAGQKIVLYARSGVWWVQPTAAAPFTEIGGDSGWRNQTHPGTAYAALLVEAGYRPGLKTETLPEKGDGVLAVAVAQKPRAPAPDGITLRFAGYRWRARAEAFEPGGTRNEYDPANASVDSAGLLHLKITGHPGSWKSAEVWLNRSLGYGTYRFVLRDVSRLEPSAVFTMQTWDDGPSREMDIEISKWGQTSARNGQFVVQPYYVPANTIQFQAPAGRVTFMLRWLPGQAAFRAFRGAVSQWETTPVREHVFTSGVPSPGNESVYMNLYVFGNDTNPLRGENEVVVEAFEYLP